MNKWIVRLDHDKWQKCREYTVWAHDEDEAKAIVIRAHWRWTHQIILYPVSECRITVIPAVDDRILN